MYTGNTGLQPSRKDQIMLFAILGWTVCGILSIFAYTMARDDLANIDAGLMEPRDRDTVNTLRIVSLVQLILMGVGIAGMCCVFGAQLLMVGGAGAYGGGY